jgi:hypothetical protein
LGSCFVFTSTRSFAHTGGLRDTEFPMDVNQSVIDIPKWVAGSRQNIDGISKFMEGFGGGIPAHYYVREEEMMVFKCFKKEWENNTSNKR